MQVDPKVVPLAAGPSAALATEDGGRCSPCAVCGRNVPLRSRRRHARAHRGEKRYSCHACGLGFGDGGNLARHARAVHGRQRPHACPVCGKAFSRRSHLQDHVRSHSESRDFVCDVCGKASKSGAALRMHRKIHGAREYRCLECGSAFKRSSELRAHVTVHTGEKAHSCPCGRSFRLRSQLTAHARTHAREFEDIEDFVVRSSEPPQYAPPPTRACVYCLARVPENFYKEHLVASHSDNLFHCDECDTYVDRKEFILHMSLHAVEYAAKQDRGELVEKTKNVPEKDAEVKEESEKDERDGRRSGKRTRRRGDRGEPARLSTDGRGGAAAKDSQANEFSDHSDAENDFGPLPESVFEAIEDSQESSPAAAGRGSPAPAPPPPARDRTAAEKKVRTCQICGKAYAASSSYFYHMKHFHGRSREHECATCGRKFGTRAALAQHEPLHTGACAYGCERCGKRFRSKAGLYIHTQTHGGDKRWACAQCGRAFRWRAQLARHAARHAGAREHACTQCGRRFSVRADLLRHARTHARGHHACPACPLAFAQRRYLKVHLARKHPRAADAPTSA